METNNKLREALGKILWCLKWMSDNTDDKSVQSHLGEPIALAKAALAEPVKNCEVGTAEDLECSFFALYELEKPQNAYTTMSDIDKATNEDCARLARAVMDADLAAVCSCDAIYLLRGWETSRGAKKELAEALAHGLTIMQEGEGEE